MLGLQLLMARQGQHLRRLDEAFGTLGKVLEIHKTP